MAAGNQVRVLRPEGSPEVRWAWSVLLLCRRAERAPLEGGAEDYMGPDFWQLGNLVTVNPYWIKVNLSLEINALLTRMY